MRRCKRDVTPSKSIILQMNSIKSAFSDELKFGRQYDIQHGRLVRIGSSGQCISRRALPLSKVELAMLSKLPLLKPFTKESFSKACIAVRRAIINGLFRKSRFRNRMLNRTRRISRVREA